MGRVSVSSDGHRHSEKVNKIVVLIRKEKIVFEHKAQVIITAFIFPLSSTSMSSDGVTQNLLPRDQVLSGLIFTGLLPFRIVQ